MTAREPTAGLRNEPASFRDPASSVFYSNGRVLRGLSPRGAEDWARLAGTEFFPRLVAEKKAVATTVVEPGSLPEGAAGHDYAVVLEHERIPFVSYPYEWTFAMLRDAAVLHLEILLAALDDGMTMKDGYAFNVQWQGTAPTFIDIGSFESGGGPWVGYRQFCQTFLYPLLLEAHLGVSFQRFLLGHLEGLEPGDMRRLFGGRRRFKKGVFRNVYLHSVIQDRVTRSTQSVQEDLKKAGFSTELTKATAKKLLKLVRRLRSKRSGSNWSEYRDTCSYTDAERAAKERFVTDAAKARRPALVWDLGCNDGAFARLVAEHAGYVVAVDADDVVVDRLYRALRADGPANVLPLVMNLVDPSPGRGWRNTERRAFADRGAPDLVLGLALVHHLAIAANVPLAEVVAWLRSFDCAVVVEFVAPEDPMAQQLLANKPPGLHDDYRPDTFEALLEAEFTVEQRELLPGGTRTLYLVTPRR
ncbi:MAG TPA: methyltransferase [Acidimicrobiia bacterium]|nr:methyltransferase [Acidimicrobiia bacterium]